MAETLTRHAQQGLLLANAAVGAWAWARLPANAQVPIHFGLDGQADAWAAPLPGLLWLPALALLLYGLRRILPHLDPRGDHLRQSERALDAIWLTLLGFLAGLQVFIVLQTLGWIGPVLQWPVWALAALMAGIGNVLGKLRSNFFVGIRTPWTLSSEHVWDQTHRWAGRLFVGAAVALAVLAGAMPRSAALLPLAVTVLVLASLAPALQSWRLWRAAQGRSTDQ